MVGLMFTTNRQNVLDALYLMGVSCCAYSGGEVWADRCDCKYGIGKRDGWPTMHESGNGCPELRSLHSLIEAMTDEEWALLVSRSRGVPSGLFAASEQTIAARLTNARTSLTQAERHLAELRELLTTEIAT